MNSLLTLLHVYLYFGGAYTASFKINTQPEGRIVGGHEANPYSHPYMASLQLRFFWVRAHFCGGAILNENWILTAAHCIKESWLIRWLSVDAILGAHNVDNFGPKAQIVNIQERIAHSGYKGGIGPHDIAVLKTKTPIIFTDEIKPINLPQANSKLSVSELILSGWGALRTTAFFPDLPSRLQEVELTYIPYKECYRALEELDDDDGIPLDENANICTGPIKGGIAACNGDSGGPLVYYSKNIKEKNDTTTVKYDYSNEDSIENEIPNDEYVFKNSSLFNEKDKDPTPTVIGVVSWGVSPCGKEGAPTIYTKVSRYLDFITSHINS